MVLETVAHAGISALKIEMFIYKILTSFCSKTKALLLFRNYSITFPKGQINACMCMDSVSGLLSVSLQVMIMSMYFVQVIVQNFL